MTARPSPDGAETPEPGMVKEGIILPDGRYLIYYSFPEDEA